jgi:nucleoside-diphosphate-sugar epimerase
MRIALTGASGFIGSRIAHHLADGGHQVTALVRETSRRDHIEPHVDRFVVGNQDDDSVWPDLLDGAECVIHNSVDWSPLRGGADFDRHLQTNLVGSLRRLDAARDKQFVFISTIAVHHDMSPRWEGVIDEEHPLRPGSWYGAYKAAVEAHLWAAHFSREQHTCAVRPCGVYGLDPNLDRAHFSKQVGELRKLAETGGRYEKQGGGKFVHVEDVAAVVAAVVGNDAANGEAYNLVDCYARWADWAKMACEVMGIEVDIDMSSPEQPKNVFRKDKVQALGVEMDRGHEGIRAYLRELIETV